MMDTTAAGAKFRDLIASHLVAAGFEVSTEARAAFKKADIRAIWTRDELDGLTRYLVETKSYHRTLPLAECVAFAEQYGSLVRSGEAHRAWLISEGPISTDGRAAIESNHQLRCFSLHEFQRTLLKLDSYLRDIIVKYESEYISQYYIPPHTVEGERLSVVVERWLDESFPPPLAIISGYGKGKTTFARTLAVAMAREALNNPSVRIPILIPLGELIDEISIDGLLGKVFSSRYRALNYHFHLFQELNRAGRFLIILDGFDEMKHGMTFAMFERAFTELMKLDVPEGRLMILGRDTAFHNDVEFRSVIMGRQKTGLGAEIRSQGRRPSREITLRAFTSEEVERYVTSYFPILARANGDGSSSDAWIARKIAEILDPSIADLIVRPVHAQMVCEVATMADSDLRKLTKTSLYDKFIHLLLEREVRKRGRDPAFPVATRRHFNSQVAWWLWTQGRASTSTLETIPTELCRLVSSDISHDYDDTGLKRELSAGLLVEKARDAIYFPHRSIQEFLVAEHLIRHGPDYTGSSITLKAALDVLNPEIGEIMLSHFGESEGGRVIAREWLDGLLLLRGELPMRFLSLPVQLYRLVGPTLRISESPWDLYLEHRA